MEENNLESIYKTFYHFRMDSLKHFLFFPRRASPVTFPKVSDLIEINSASDDRLYLRSVSLSIWMSERVKTNW